MIIIHGDIELAVQKAQEAFWEVVAKHFPEIKTGDFAPEQQWQFDNACQAAVRAWLENNSR